MCLSFGMVAVCACVKGGGKRAMGSCGGEIGGVYLLMCVYGLCACVCACVNLAVICVRLGYLFSTRVWMFYRENRCRATLSALCVSGLCVCALVRQTERVRHRGIHCCPVTDRVAVCI